MSILSYAIMLSYSALCLCVLKLLHVPVIYFIYARFIIFLSMFQTCCDVIVSHKTYNVLIYQYFICRQALYCCLKLPLRTY